jgi:hypothetical protein
MKIGVIADTHLYHQEMPSRVLLALEGVDLLLHAGDILELKVLEELQQIAPTKAVVGNMDLAEVRETLPAKLVFEAEGRKIGLIHGWGGPPGITRRIRPEFEEVDVIVFGHTHTVYNRVEEGIYFFNPGSPTDRMFTQVNSVGILDLEEEIAGRIILLD